MKVKIDMPEKDKLSHYLQNTDRFDTLLPEEIIFELFKQFKDRAAIITSGQLTGMVQLHMAYENGIPFRVCTIDTLRLFPETYKFFEKVEKRYDIKIERQNPDAEQVDRMIAHHGEFLFFDSKEKQEYCCSIRKVKPLEKLLETVDVWFSGLRRDQSEHRKEVRKAQLINRKGRSILKVNALADWTLPQIWKFIKKHEIPVNPLLMPDRNGHFYESLGCEICTTPTRSGETKRSGRWRWQNSQSTENRKECGLHYSI